MEQATIQFKIENKEEGNNLIPLIEVVLNKIGMQNTLIRAMNLRSNEKVKFLFKNELLELFYNYPKLNQKYDFGESDHEIALFKVPLSNSPKAIRVFSIQFNNFQ